MPCERRPMRYGHSEGHTEVCFDDTGKLLVTCGSDGDVRIWAGLDDDDPKSFSVGEKAFSLAVKGARLVTAASNNTVQIHTFPDGEPDGVVTRFTTNPTHVTFDLSGSRVAAASSDFLVKVVDVEDSSRQKTLRGHEAPVLSVTFDPKDQFLASSSCDGSVVVWNVEDQTRVTSWSLLQKTNDVDAAKSLCRLAWQPGAAQLLAVPVETEVHLYGRSSWEHLGTLADERLTQPLNVVAWSPCGRFLAAASVGGFLTVWDVSSRQCVERQKHEKGFTVCSLAWHPSGRQIAYTDTEGCLGLLDGLGAPPAAAKVPVKDYDSLFDDDDDDRVLDEGLSETASPAKKVSAAVDEEDEDEDFLVPATGRVRNRGAFLDDDNSMDTASLKLGRDNLLDEDAGSAAPAAPPPPPRPAYDGPLPTPPQKAFQPGSTPAHLTHRFMVWNSVGIVRGYNDELDNAIDVEFHDSAVHHAMHLTNSLGHAVADLSQEAVLLACPSTEELASKLQCLHFSSWDTNKDWMLDLPAGEDARALCLGRGWAAVATSSLMLRLFSIGGVQRGVFSLPGPVVCLAGHGEQLLIVYHRATGFDGDQALGVQLLQLGRRKRRVLGGEPLPLSLRAHLSWLGFTAEGTPCYVDSDGVVRLLNRSLGNSWTPVCNTRETCKSRSDHYWVVGVHENPQQLRCIPCKGSRYPPTLPRPAVAILPFKLPLCQTATEKGQMEEHFLRSALFHNHHSFLSSSGYEVDEEARSRSQKEQQELLMKMFALSCKLEREFRCVELAEMMTHSVVTLAIRYASRSRRLALAQRLSELALERAGQEEEHEEQQEEEEQEEEQETRHTVRRRRTASAGRHHQEEEEEEQEEEEEEEQQPGEEEDQQEAEEAAESRTRLKTLDPEDVPPAAPGGRAGRANPFKVAAAGKPPPSSTQPRASNILDNMAAGRKSAPLGGSGGKTSKTPVLKPLEPKTKTKTKTKTQTQTQTQTKTQSTLSSCYKAPQKKKSQEAPPRPEAPPPENTENQRPRTGFQLWLQQNRKNILAEQPDLQETDVIREAVGRFRTLSGDERLSWTERAKGPTGDEADGKKRKRVEGGEEEEGGGGGEEVEKEKAEDEEKEAKKKRPAAASSKLSAFAFNKS